MKIIRKQLWNNKYYALVECESGSRIEVNSKKSLSDKDWGLLAESFDSVPEVNPESLEKLKTKEEWDSYLAYQECDGSRVCLMRYMQLLGEES